MQQPATIYNTIQLTELSCRKNSLLKSITKALNYCEFSHMKYNSLRVYYALQLQGNSPGCVCNTRIVALIGLVTL